MSQVLLKKKQEKIKNDSIKYKINKYNIINNNINNFSLLPKNYIKSLEYAFNNHIQAINTQFDHFNKDSFPNYTTYRYIEDNTKSKNSFQTFNIKNNNSNYISKNENSQKYKKYGNTKNKTQINQKNKNNSNNNLGHLSENEINTKIIKIQSCYRYHLKRNKLYNTIYLYSKISKFFDILQNVFTYYKRLFVKKINKKENIHKEKNKFIKNNIKYNCNINNVIKDLNNIDIISYFKNKKEDYQICNINKILINQESIKNGNNISSDKSNIINYTICNINNININNIENINKNNNFQNSFLEDKKNYEEKIIQLSNENKIIKGKNIEYQNRKKIFNNMKKENEKLNIQNAEIKKENAQLISELKNTKEKYENFLKGRKNIFQKNIIIKQIEINIIKEKEKEININKNDNNNNIINNNHNEITNKNDESNINENGNNTNQAKIIDKKQREKYLKNLFKNKVFEMKEYIHKCFTKFYYNGIFLQMTGKLSHLDKKSENNDEKTEVHNLNFSSEDENNNENENEKTNIKENNVIKKVHFSLLDIQKREEEKSEKQEEKEEKEKAEKKARLKRSRSLRRLMIKKVNERRDLLRLYFYKFYRAGIVNKFRSIKKRKTCQVRESIKLSDLNINKINSGEINSLETPKRLKSTKGISSKDLKEKEELKQKIVEILERIIFKTDRKNMIILKGIFQKFYLKVKIESVTNIIVNDKAKKKKKKKMKKKKNSETKKIIDKEQENIQNNEKDNKDIKGKKDEYNENN